MSNSNPIIPPGSPLHATMPAKRSTLFVTTFVVVALHVVFLAGLLIQGCKRQDDQAARPLPDLTNSVTSPETTPPAVTPPPTPIPVETNLPAPPVSTQPPPSPPPDAAAPPPPPAKEYKVARGDSLSRIAQAHGLSVQAIAEANPGIDSNKIRVGQKLHIPAATGARDTTAVGSAASAPDSGVTIYVVKAGDTLTRIAKAHGTTVEAIRAATGMKTHQILVGQKLKVPGAKKASSSTQSSSTATDLSPPSTNATAAERSALPSTEPRH